MDKHLIKHLVCQAGSHLLFSAILPEELIRRQLSVGQSHIQLTKLQNLLSAWPLSSWKACRGPGTAAVSCPGGAEPRFNSAAPCRFPEHLLLARSRPWFDGCQLLTAHYLKKSCCRTAALMKCNNLMARYTSGNKKSGFLLKGKLHRSPRHLHHPSPPSLPYPLSVLSHLPEVRDLKQPQVPHTAKFSQNPCVFASWGYLRNSSVSFSYTSHNPHTEIQCKSLVPFISGFDL